MTSNTHKIKTKSKMGKMKRISDLHYIGDRATLVKIIY